jgi:hypothetical protein
MELTDAARINLKQNGLAATDGIYLERSGERRGYHMFVGAPNDGLTFRANNNGTFTTAMYLNRDGNVGIGQTNPSGKLEVNGGYVTLRNGASAYPDGISAPVIYGSTGGGSNSFDHTGNLVLQSRSDAGSYSICFVTGDTPTERMRITSTGNAEFKGSVLANNIDVSSNSGNNGWKLSEIVINRFNRQT